ncbi:hypothetical protein [Pseudonocardia zijingensis]|uniref:Uncharacterized protein n=1 Tax=Pseudonocardia zijingensis TaxID=153376 RepID=A0ABP3Z2X8_9PSEU
MAWKQSRTTRRLLAQGELDNRLRCQICKRTIPRRSGMPVCNQPRCLSRYATQNGGEVD